MSFVPRYYLWYTKMAKILGYYWKRMDQLTLPGAACQFTIQSCVHYFIQYLVGISNNNNGYKTIVLDFIDRNEVKSVNCHRSLMIHGYDMDTNTPTCKWNEEKCSTLFPFVKLGRRCVLEHWLFFLLAFGIKISRCLHESSSFCAAALRQVISSKYFGKYAKGISGRHDPFS